MKKRFGISRCCCGDGGGAGTCNDTCLGNWGGNSASAVGQLTTVLPPSFSDVIANDLWYVSNQPSPPNVTGQNGDFQFDGNGFRQTTNLEKQFSFDYRTNTTIEIESTVEVQPVTFVSGHSTSASIQILGFGLVAFGGYNPPNAAPISGFFDDRNGNRGALNSPIITFRVVLTIGQTLATFQRSSVPYIDNNGNEQSVEGCTDLKQITVDRYANGALFSTSTHQAEFAGVRCYSGASIAGQGWSGSFLSPPVPVFSRHTTITVS